MSLPPRLAHAARSASLIAAGNAGSRRCSSCVNRGRLDKATLITVTSRRRPSISCKYSNGNVSLSPAVKTIARGGSVWSALAAKSLAKYRLDASCDCQLRMSCPTGTSAASAVIAMASTRGRVRSTAVTACSPADRPYTASTAIVTHTGR